MSSRADQLADVLDAFLEEAPEIQAAAVVSVDGLPMASALPPDVEEERLAAMSAALHTLGERAATGLGKGGLEQVFVEAEDGYIVLMAAGENAVLVAVADRSAKAGLVIFEMRKASEAVAKVLDESSSSSTPSNLKSAPPRPKRSEGLSGLTRVEEVADHAAPVLDPFATPTEPFLAPPPPPFEDEGDEEAISNWQR